MSYRIDQVGQSFVIKLPNQIPALKAIKSLKGQETVQEAGFHRPTNHFRFVDADFWKIDNIFEMMKHWGWRVNANDDGDIINIRCMTNALGDDLILFKAIAPFVEPGSFIEIKGEENAQWRWIFDGKTCEEKQASVKLSWE